jgi:hypothetical protein
VTICKLSLLAGYWGCEHTLVPDFVAHADRQVTDHLLPVGVHSATQDEVEEALVDKFPRSLTRRRVFNGWCAFRTQVRQLVQVDHEYIDGSFVTGRLNPKDVDVSLWIRADTMNALDTGRQSALSQLLKDAKALYHSDAYVVPHCSSGHSLYRVYQTQLWTKQYWRMYKNVRGIVVPGAEKGYIEVVS